jgi:hypothetical protein
MTRRHSSAVALTVSAGLLVAAIGACCLSIAASAAPVEHCHPTQDTELPEAPCCVGHAAGEEALGKIAAIEAAGTAAPVAPSESMLPDVHPQPVSGEIAAPASDAGRSLLQQSCVLRI